LKLFSELALLRKGKGGLLIPLLAAIAIPLIYVLIYLSNLLDPPETLPDVPVAVVNMDKGADNDGEKLTVGDDLVKELQKEKKLGWEFVSEEDADQGLKDNKYYLVIKIPEDFSERATTVMDNNPQKLPLEYIQNEGKSRVVAEVTDGAIETIRETLATKVTKKYVNNVFTSLGDIADGYQTAADGANKIHDGSTQLHDGSSLLHQTLTGKAGDIQTLANGANELADGTKTMYSNLSGKSSSISELAAGTKTLYGGIALLHSNLQTKLPNVQKLAAGTKEIEKGLSDLKPGTEAILGGLKQTQAGTDGFKTKLEKELLPGSTQLKEGINGVKASVDKLSGVSASVSKSLSEFLDKHPELKTDSEFLTIVETSATLSGNMENLKSGLTPLQQGAARVEGGISESVAGTQSLFNALSTLVANQEQKIVLGTAQLLEGSKQVASGNADIEAGWNTLISSTAQLNDGAKKINDGNQTVEKGWKELTVGANKINTGMIQVSNGTQTVNTGWGELTAGVQQLDTGLGDLNKGANELATGLEAGAEETGSVQTGDKNVEMFVSPVELVSNTVNEFDQYRDSSAPYILSLALFVGLLIMTIFVDMKTTASGVETNSILSRLTTLIFMAIAQAVVVALSTMFILNLNVESGIMYLVFMIVTSLTFLMLILLLISLAGHVGRFILFVLLLIQLIISGGNAPIEALPASMQGISHFLPMTHSISGFKSLISLGEIGSAWTSLGILVVFLIICTILTIGWNYLKSKDADQPRLV
jgi:putative membrane protein